MKLTLTNYNSGDDFKAGEKKYPLLIVPVQNGYYITTEDGTPIACLDAEEAYRKTDDGKKVATGEFFLGFHVIPSDRVGYVEDRDAAAHVVPSKEGN